MMVKPFSQLDKELVPAGFRGVPVQLSGQTKEIYQCFHQDRASVAFHLHLSAGARKRNIKIEKMLSGSD